MLRGGNGNNAVTVLGLKLLQLGNMLSPDVVDRGPFKSKLGEPLGPPFWLALLFGSLVVDPRLQPTMGWTLHMLWAGTLLTGEIQQLEIVVQPATILTDKVEPHLQ